MSLPHIGIIAPDFPPEVGGMQVYARQVAHELARRGHRVTVFTRPHEQGEFAFPEPTVTVDPALRLRRRLDREIIRRHDKTIDAWHCMNAVYAWVALETRKPVVVSVHGNDFLSVYLLVERLDLRSRFMLPLRTGWENSIGRRRTRAMLARALPRCSGILANSRYTMCVFLEMFPGCAERTVPAMVGVSEDFFDVQHRPRGPGEPPRLITVGRLSEKRKNVDVVLRALAKLRDRHAFRYTIVGDGSQRPTLERLVEEAGLRGRVTFTGYVDADRMKRLLAESDLFVLTSSIVPGSHEGFGIVYLEANAAGVPVLAARLAGAVEAVDEGVSGMFVDEPTVDAVAAKLDDFLAGRASFNPEACRAFARRFTWASVVDRAERFYTPAAPPER